MSVNRVRPFPLPLGGLSEERSVFVSAPVRLPHAQKTLREHIVALLSRVPEERCMTDEELRLWSEDDFHPRAWHPHAREGAPHDASAKGDYVLCVTMAHPVRANAELERLLSANMAVLARIETSSRVLSERLFAALQGMELKGITRECLAGAAKACAEVVVERYERECRTPPKPQPADDVPPTWDDGYSDLP